MKKLNFVLKNNDDFLYNEDTSYSISDNYINFKIENNEFKICLIGNFHFIKETAEDIFEIRKSDSTMSATYTLKSHNITLDVKVLDFKYTFRDKIYNIKYNIESDPDSVKEIILTLD